VKVDHVTFSKSGGAGLVAGNLVAHQQGLGVQARLNSIIDSNLFSDPLSHPVITAAAIMDRYVVSNSPNDTLFSLYRNRIGALDKKILERDSILHLHWVNGVITSEHLLVVLESGRRVIWTLHDMSPFTGGCHHAHTCQNFEANCSNCPQVSPFFKKRIELKKKKDLLPDVYSNLTLVTPTLWMEKRVKASSKFRDFRVVTIPNPISEEFLRDINKESARNKLGIKPDSVVFIAVASHLSDSAKNIQGTVAAFMALQGSSQKNHTLLLVGENGEKFSNPELKIRWLGKMEPPALAEVAAASDWVLSNSVAESAGMTIAECGALGVPAIVLDSGGITEMLLPSQSGLIARNDKEFRSHLMLAGSKLANQETLGGQAKLFARTKFSPSAIAQAYINLY
jgi:glycosyltransferase involved in cell wall biosynthesis